MTHVGLDSGEFLALDRDHGRSARGTDLCVVDDPKESGRLNLARIPR